MILRSRGIWLRRRTYDISTGRRRESEELVIQRRAIFEIGKSQRSHVAERIGEKQGAQVERLRIEAHLDGIATVLRLQRDMLEAVVRRVRGHGGIEVMLHISDSQKKRRRARRPECLLQWSLDHLVEVGLIIVKLLAIADDEFLIVAAELPSHTARLAIVDDALALALGAARRCDLLLELRREGGGLLIMLLQTIEERLELRRFIARSKKWHGHR